MTFAKQKKSNKIAVCVLFLMRLGWPKMKSVYDHGGNLLEPKNKCSFRQLTQCCLNVGAGNRKEFLRNYYVRDLDPLTYLHSLGFF